MGRFNGRLLLPLILLVGLSLSMAVIAPAVPRAQAQPSPSLTIQPASQASLAVGSTFTVQVNVGSMDQFDTWDITVHTDASVILPLSISVAGNIFGSVNEFINCVNGVGTGCTISDTGPTAHSGATSGSGFPRSGNGLLFSVTYQVVGDGSSFISIPLTLSSNQIIFQGSQVPHDTSSAVYGTPVAFDYSLSNSGPVTIQQGSSGTVTITATLSAGTAQPVTLSCVSSSLPTGITCGSFSVNPVTPIASGATSNLPISVASSLAPGSYTLQVTGTPAGTTVSAATTNVSVTVVTLTAGPDFTLTASPTSVTVSVGVAATSTITVGPLNGFTGDLSLTSDNAPCSLAPATVSGGSGTSTLSCTFSTTGSFVVTVTGTSGSLVHTATVDFTVTAAAGFDLSWQGYDWDGGHEEILYFNGQFLTSLPPVDTPSNGGAWASLSFDITSYVVKGTNTLTFTHANWDCSVSDAVGNLQVTSGATVVYSNSASLPLTCTQWLTYTFVVGTAPPPPAPPELSISAGQSTAFPVVGETLTFSALSSGGVPPYMFTWNFGDDATGFGSTVNHEYAAPGTYTARATVADSASPPDTNFVDIIVTVSAPSSSPGTYTLSWQGYDWDGGQEEMLTINGQMVATLPPVDTPSSGGVWASFSFDITSYVVKGTNTLTFTHANWDCSVSDSVRNLQLTNGTMVVYGNATASPLACSQPLTYTFSV